MARWFTLPVLGGSSPTSSWRGHERLGHAHVDGERGAELIVQTSAVAEPIKRDEKSRSRFSSFLALNIIATGLRPRKSLFFFASSWLFFFIILLVIPTPPGMSPSAKATLAVVVWACLTWIGEVVPVGITGLQIPMLLSLTAAVQGGQGALGRAASGFTSPPAFICLAAFIMAAIIQVATLDRRIALGLLHAAKVKTVNENDRRRRALAG